MLWRHDGCNERDGTDLPADRPLTVDDLEFLPDDGSRYELDDGVLVVSPAQANIHQLVVSRLQMLLGAACPREFLVVSGNGVAMTRTNTAFPTWSSCAPRTLTWLPSR